MRSLRGAMIAIGGLPADDRIRERRIGAQRLELAVVPRIETIMRLVGVTTLVVLGMSACAPDVSQEERDAAADATVLLPRLAHATWADVDPTAIFEGAIEQPRERDVFAFRATEGSWIAVEANAIVTEDGFWTMVPVLRLYDPAGALVATNRGVPRGEGGAPTARIIVPVLASGIYYAEIEEDDSREAEPEFGENVRYYIAIAAERGGPPTGVQVVEDGEGVPLARAPYLAGWIDRPGDADVIAFEVTGGGGQAIGVFVPGPTAEGGGGAPLAGLRITDLEGRTTLAALGEDRLSDPLGARLAAPLGAGRYHLHVAGGPTPTHYVLMEGVGASFVVNEPWEPRDADNDEPGNATPANVNDPIPGLDPYYWFVTYLDSPGDRDWYSIDVPSGLEWMLLRCDAEQTGSPVTGISVRLLDPAGGPLAYLVEQVSPGIVSGVNWAIYSPPAGRYIAGIFGRIGESAGRPYVVCQLFGFR